MASVNCCCSSTFSPDKVFRTVSDVFNSVQDVISEPLTKLSMSRLAFALPTFLQFSSDLLPTATGETAIRSVESLYLKMSQPPSLISDRFCMKTRTGAKDCAAPISGMVRATSSIKILLIYGIIFTGWNDKNRPFRVSVPEKGGRQKPFLINLFQGLGLCHLILFSQVPAAGTRLPAVENWSKKGAGKLMIGTKLTTLCAKLLHMSFLR